MPFVKNDSRINRSGRPKESTRTVKSKLRKLEKTLEGILDTAIAEAQNTMQTAVKAETRLKAAVYIIDTYVQVHGKAVDEELNRNNGVSSDDDETPPIEAKKGPALSLTMIKKEELKTA